jgi:flagellar hook-associated protein 1 FlgK
MAIMAAFDVARKALFAQEAALGVVGNNIANVNTPGYTRQVPELVESESTHGIGGILFGHGVDMQAIRQVLDPLIDQRLLQAGADRGEQSARSDQLGELAQVVNDLDDPSLPSTLDGFYAAADALARNPAGIAERQNLIGQANTLAAGITRRAGALADLQRAVDDRYSQLGTEANDSLTKIAALNRDIVSREVDGQSANDLRDARRNVLNQLSQTLRVSVLEDPNGAVRVSASNGAVLVENGSVVNSIAVRGSGVGLDGQALHEIGLADAEGTFLSAPAAFSGGTIGGLASVRDGAIVTASQHLDTFVAGSGSNPGLIGAVNAIQQAGRDLDGNATTAVPLFGGTSAATLSVLITDPRQIAAAQSTDPGDNRNALALADLRTTTLTALGNQTLTGYLALEQARIGDEASLASDQAAATDLLGKHLESERDAVSGVNLNEELTNLLRYQRAFQAASQVLNVANSALDSLFAAVG